MKTVFKRFLTTRFLAFALVAISAGSMGTVLMHSSSAATSGCGVTYQVCNAYGDIDSCALQDGATVIYGWATDPDAPKGVNPYVDITVGATKLHVPTDQVGYRDAPINAYITAAYPSQPQPHETPPNEYGFRAVFHNLYKGNTYGISGIADNYGSTGTSSALSINNKGHADNDPSKPYFAGNVVPADCLATAPAPPTPPGGGTGGTGGTGGSGTGGTGSGTGTGGTGSSGTGNTGSHSTGTGSSKQPANPAVGPTNDANATVTVGTLGADVVVPAGNATSIHLSYGKDGDVAITTNDQAVNGDSVTVHLTDLIAQSIYNYQIIRTNAVGSTTSNVATFATSGFGIDISFVNKQNKPVSGIKATINDDSQSTATSDSKGKLSFGNLAAGQYNVTYDYNGQRHIQSYDTANAKPLTSAEQASVVSLTDTINVDDVLGHKAATKTHHSPWPIIIIGLLLVVAAIIAIVVMRRRKALSRHLPYTPAPAPAQPDIIDRRSLKEFAKKQPPAEPAPEHMGQSLREMVVQSMRDEAARRKQQQPPQNGPHDPSAQQ